MTVKNLGVVRVEQCTTGLTIENVWGIYETDPDAAIAFVYDKMSAVLVHSFKKYFWTSEEDRISTLMLSIDKALKSYDPEKGTTFKTFVTNCYRNALLAERDYIFAKTKGRDWFVEAVYFDSESNVDGGEGFNERNSLENTPVRDFETEKFELLDEAFIMSLSDNQYRYLQLVLNSPMDTVIDAEAARMLNITRMGVAKIRKSIAKKLEENNLI